MDRHITPGTSRSTHSSPLDASPSRVPLEHSRSPLEHSRSSLEHLLPTRNTAPRNQDLPIADSIVMDYQMLERLKVDLLNEYTAENEQLKQDFDETCAEYRTRNDLLFVTYVRNLEAITIEDLVRRGGVRRAEVYQQDAGVIPTPSTTINPPVSHIEPPMDPPAEPSVEPPVVESNPTDMPLELPEEARELHDEATASETEKRAWRSERRPPSNNPNWSDQVDAERPHELRVRLHNGDNKLSPDKDFGLWRANIKTQLLASDCLFVIDDTSEPSVNYTPVERARLTNIVQAYLISNLDQHYQMVVSDLEHPKDVMKALQNICRPCTVHHEHSIRRELDRIYFDPKAESAVRFIARFNDKIQQLRCCPGVVFDESAEKYVFMMAVNDAFPDLYNVEESAGASGRPVRQLKEMLISNETRLNELSKRVTRQRNDKALKTTSNTRYFTRSDTHGGDYSSKFCRICGLNDHDESRCPYGEKVCYNCRKPGHVSRQCIYPQTPQSRLRRVRSRESISPGPHTRKSSASRSLKRPSPSPTRSKTGSNRYRSPVSARRPRKTKKTAMTMPEFARESKRRIEMGKARLVFEDTIEDANGDRMVIVALESDDSDLEADTAAIAKLKLDKPTDEPEDLTLAFMGRFEGEPTKISFIVDSGATNHIVNNLAVMMNARSLTNSRYISCANGNSEMEVLKIGDILVHNNKLNSYSILRDVLYAPDLVDNLFSIRKQVRNSISAVFR